MNSAWRSLAAVCVLVIGVYAYMTQKGLLELANLKAADATTIYWCRVFAPAN